MKKIFGKDIKDLEPFNRAGYRYEKVYEDLSNHIVIWSMNDGSAGKYQNFELWLGKRLLNPDGTVVYVKPKDEDWGAYGWSYYGTPEFCWERMKAKIAEITKDVEGN